MSFDPNLRPKLEEVLSHPWFMGEVPTRKEVLEQFQNRRKLVEKHEEQERLERKQQRMQK